MFAFYESSRFKKEEEKKSGWAKLKLTIQLSGPDQIHCANNDARNINYSNP